MALKIASKNPEEEHEEDDEDINDSIALITKILTRVMKKINTRPSKGLSQCVPGSVSQRGNRSKLLWIR